MKKMKINMDIITRHLLNETDINEKQMINKLFNDDELSRREFESYLDVWEKSANVKELEKIDTTSDWLKVRSKLDFKQTSKRIPLHSYLLRIAAVLVFVFGLTYVYTHFLRGSKTNIMEYYETATTKTAKELKLSDGTLITLNRNSRIIQNSDFGISNRDIILEGEAFFDVAKNPVLPFKVHTQNSTVEVLGTSFNIKCDSQKVIVGVVRGKVAFYQTGNQKNRVELIKDNTGIYELGTNSLIAEEYLNLNSIAWRTGKLIFKKTPDHDVFRTIAEYFDKELVIQPDAPLDIFFTGEFDKQSLEEMIDIFNISRPSKYKVDVITTDNRIIVKKR